MTTPEDEEMAPKTKSSEETRKVLVSLHANVAIHSACVFMQGIAFTYLSKRLGVSPTVWGYLNTCAALCHLVGSPIYGRFGDLYGGRKALALSFLSMFATCILLAVADSVPMLFISRLPLVFMQVMPGAHMVVADATDDASRSDAMGKVGMFFGIGLLIGPVLGGWLSEHYSEHLTCVVAAVLSLLQVVLVMLFVPAQMKPVSQDEHRTKSAGSSVFDMKEIARLCSIPQVKQLLIIRCLSLLPSMLLQSTFPIIMASTFDMGPQDSGIFMAYIGLVSMLTMGVGVGIITKRFTDLTILRCSTMSFIVSNVFMIGASKIWHMYVTVTPADVGGATMGVIMNSALTKVVPAEDTGAVMGLSGAMQHLVHTVAPSIGGWLLENYGFPSIGILAAALNTALVLYLFLGNVSKSFTYQKNSSGTTTI
ncbi:solute carrier family 22 member 18-like isoform X1 [Branchiostoma lanceolatum]|uniref:solute carrier family 22 member 18-like isoform X1 n=1 Tax=Branchiostoma lanceolatum TaxID=7740 RepID=UPI0034553587